MSTKRPMIKFRNRQGKVKVKKLSSSYIIDKIWPTFRDTYLEIVNDVEVKKRYDYDDIVDIIFDHKEIKRERRNKHEVIE